jgi:ATP-dependent DNA helicase RecQ
MSKAVEILEKYWGYKSFRPMQLEIVEAAIYGHDVLALLPTGGGKSICFQVPGLVREGVCLVVSPLIALMEDQVMNLKKRGIEAEFIVSGMTYKEIDILLDRVRFGNVKFLYTSPERLQSRLFIERCKLMNIGLIAVDEAHCISQWGYDFRPPYLDISYLRDLHPNTPIIALTASATTRVKEDIVHFLKLKNHHYFEGDFARSNLSYEVYHVNNKEAAVIHMVSKYRDFTGIIYCQTRKSTKFITQVLTANKLSADFYHGGLTREERKVKQSDWIEGRTKVIVATNAFGMGIDKPNVRFVLHYEFPDSLEAFYQEAGRAGRDGDPARTMAFIGDHDLENLEQRMLQRFPEPEEVKRVYDALCNHLQLAIGSGKDETYPLEINDFLKKYPFDAITVYNSLKVLELNKSLTFNENSFQKTRVLCIVSNTMLYDFQIKNRQLDPLISMISRTHSGIFEGFVNLDEYGLCKALNINITELRRQLGILESNGLYEINWKTDLPQVTFLVQRLPDTHFQLKPEVLKVRKQVAVEKFGYVINYLTEFKCRSKQLVAYFGQHGEPCGICDVCKTESKSESKSSFTNIRDLILNFLSEPRSFIEIKIHLSQADDTQVKELLFDLLDEKKIKFDGKKYTSKR